MNFFVRPLLRVPKSLSSNMRGNSWCHHRLHQFFWHTQKRNRPVIMLISFIVPFIESWNVCSLPCSWYSVAGGAYIRHKQQGWNNLVTSKLYKFRGNTVGSWGFIGSQLSQTIPSDDKFMLITQAATMETWTLLWVKLVFGNSLASFSPIVEKCSLSMFALSRSEVTTFRICGVIQGSETLLVLTSL